MCATDVKGAGGLAGGDQICGWTSFGQPPSQCYFGRDRVSWFESAVVRRRTAAFCRVSVITLTLTLTDGAQLYFYFLY